MARKILTPRSQLRKKNVSSPPPLKKMTHFNDSEWILRQGFNAPCFDVARRQEMHFDQDHAALIQVAEGAVKCRKCNSYRLKNAELQSRSLDEKSTVYYECESCKYKWSE